MENSLIKQLERGRSMIEMLGVLMIIGILSLIGIWTYDYASKYYESNKIQDVIARSKALSDVNQSSTHIYEVERFLRQNAPRYAPKVQQEEVRNSSNDNSKMTYTVTLQQVQENVCKMEFNNESSFESMGITIVSPTSAEGCSGYTDMVFEFSTVRTDIVCESDSDCAETNNPFCKKGQCVPCEPSDCSGTTPICDKISGQCEPCENDSECAPNKCAENGSCGECSSNEHCTDEFKPICDTYEGVCNTCAMDSECEPKYCALKGKCGDCSAHEHCPSSTPKCEFEYGVCEACPSGTYWHTSLQKCTECLEHAHCSGSTPKCNTGTGSCEACPSGTYWQITKQECVQCLQNSHCSGSTPKCNTESNVCEACPDGYGFSVAQDKCVLKRTVTINNVGTITTQTVLDGETMLQPSASYPDFTFSHWATSKDGSAVTFPLKITANTTLYAYYNDATEILVRNEEKNKDYHSFSTKGGSRLGSENTEKTKTFSYTNTQKFRLYLKSKWNDDAASCSKKEGSFSYTIDNVTVGGIEKPCEDIIGMGKTITLAPDGDWSKNKDVVWRAWLYRTPQITYPY